MATKCLICGSENVDRARFCERCGKDLFAPLYAPPVIAERKKASRSGIAMVAIGVFAVVFGVLLYALAMSDVFAQIDDPSVDPSDVDNVFGVMVAAYVVIAVGGIMFFVGLLLLALKSD